MLLVSNSALSQTIAEESQSTYSRSYFGNWADIDQDCQNTRHEVLLRDARTYVLSENGCRIVRGLWIDFYTGEWLTSPEEIDIDHLVPLKEIWDSGADIWSADDLHDIANDMNNLVVTSRSMNRSKGAREPHEWSRYSEVVNQCRFLNRWFTFKMDYGLNFDAIELDFLYNSGC